MPKEVRKIVIINQGVNYLTIGLTNAFAEKFDNVALVTGSIHAQGEELSNLVKVSRINRFRESPALKKMLAYTFALIRMYGLLITKYRRYELFFVSLPPMAYLLNIFLPHRFSMLIWDVYPDIFTITRMKENHIIYRTWSALNKKSFSRAFRLITISDIMADALSKYVNRDKIIVQPIWSIFQHKLELRKTDNPFISKHHLQNKFIVQYSGNIGLTHKVEVMVELAERMQEYKNILFQIIGRGPRVPILKKMVDEKQLPNCQFLPFQSDEMFPYSLSAADIGLVVLDETTSKGSVPSKSYNLMSFGVPSLYIASPESELHAYADKFGHGQCFEGENLEDAANFILSLAADQKIYNRYVANSLLAAKNFKRSNADKIVEAYLQN